MQIRILPGAPSHHLHGRRDRALGRLHPRLVWFLPFSVTLTSHGPLVPRYETWFLRLVQRLLAADGTTGAFWQRTRLGEYPTAVEASSLAEG